MTDDIVVQLGEFGLALLAFGWDRNAAIVVAAADEIERLRTALALAVGELSTHGQYSAWSPEMLLAQFMEEARRG